MSGYRWPSPHKPYQESNRDRLELACQGEAMRLSTSPTSTRKPTNVTMTTVFV